VRDQGVGTNRYAYSANDPINKSDPNGHAYAEDAVIKGNARTVTVNGQHVVTSNPKTIAVSYKQMEISQLRVKAAMANRLADAAYESLATATSKGDPWGVIASYAVYQSASDAALVAEISSGDRQLDVVTAGLILLPILRRVGKVAKVESEVAKVEREAATFSRGNFRKNLEKLDGPAPAGCDAHHVCPSKFKIEFDKAGIDIHDPKYGAWWEKMSHRRTASEYNRAWEAFFDGNENPTKQQVEEFARQVAKKYNLETGF
jgi:hypothetical protein